MRTGAHVDIVPPGPASVMICEPCSLREDHPRTRPAQDAARRHNTAEHAYPEQPLEHTDPEETR